jgi:D-3-phosphoglycerate dehydrogenase
VLVLVADAFEKSGIDGLRAAGCEVVHEPALEADALAEALARTSADVLVVRSTKVTAAMFDAGSLSLVVRAGAGYNTIDVAAASARGIYVSNCPGRNAVAVAELTLGLILALDRRIPDNVAALRAGQWDKKRFSKASGLAGRTLGLLGYGAIGREVARRAQACGLHLVVWSRSLDQAADAAALGLQAISESSIRVVAGPAEVAAASDILSVHVALSQQTKHLVNADVLSRLRPGAFFVNTARAEVVDYVALEAAVREKKLRVGLDVFRNEPSAGTGEYRDSLLELPDVYGTHHIGASTEQAQEAIAAETVRIVTAFKQTGKVPNSVNLATRTPATHLLVVRHRDRPGVLAHVFDQLREAAINVQETENVIFEGAQAAVARIHLDGRPDEGVLGRISGHGDVLRVQLLAL